jgi:hypothetical protein
MSNSVAKHYAESLDAFLADVDAFKICYCPDKITGLLLSLLVSLRHLCWTLSQRNVRRQGYRITIFGMQWQNAMLGMAADGEVNPNAYSAPEMAIMHYVTPRKLLAAEQRAEHEKLDRLVNAGAAQDVVDFFRFFINKHYEILRRKQTEIKYLAAHEPIHVNAGALCVQREIVLVISPPSPICICSPQRALLFS